MYIDLSDGARTLINKETIKDSNGNIIKEKINNIDGIELFKYKGKDGDIIEFLENENGTIIKGIKYGRFTYISTISYNH